jgi:hypothetical protein
MIRGQRRRRRQTRASGKIPQGRRSPLRAAICALALGLALLAALASAAQAQAAEVTVEFSCKGVTFHYEGFPNAPQNAITETVFVDGKATFKKFRFNGPTGTDFFAVAIPPGHHSLDGQAKWKTNGVSGGRDIKDPHGITCEAEPNYTIEKLQKIGGKTYSKETIPSAHVGQVVEYEIVLTNTGNVPLKMSAFTDTNCEAPAGAAEKTLGVGETAVITCHHQLNGSDGEAGVYCNAASITGEDGPPMTKESNTVCVELPSKSNFGQDPSCKSVTFHFFGFPKTTGNTVTEVIYVDGKVVYKAQFVFNGSSGSNTVVLNLPPGHHSLDVRAKWKTNGVRGGHDHKIGGGVNCVAEPEFTIDKLQRIGAGAYTKEPISGTLTEKIEYEVIIKNTGNVPLKFNGGFSDSKCDEAPTGGPGEAAVASGETTTYFCSHVIKETGPNTNTATATGTPTEGSPVTHESNQVVVNA